MTQRQRVHMPFKVAPVGRQAGAGVGGTGWPTGLMSQRPRAIDLLGNLSPRPNGIARRRRAGRP